MYSKQTQQIEFYRIHMFLTLVMVVVANLIHVVTNWPLTFYVAPIIMGVRFAIVSDNITKVLSGTRPRDYKSGLIFLGIAVIFINSFDIKDHPTIPLIVSSILLYVGSSTIVSKLEKDLSENS